MPAVAKAAAQRQRADVVEHAGQLGRIVDVQPQRAQARRVDHAATGRGERSVRAVVVWRPRPSSMRTAPVSCSRLAAQRVGQRALAGAAGAEHHRGLAARQPRRQQRRRLRRARVERQQRRARAERVTRLVDPPLQRRAVQRVGLGQHQHRRHRRQMGQRQIALEAARIEVAIQPHHQECGVDIGHQHLALGSATAVVGAACDLRQWRHALDHAPAARRWLISQHPVADRERVVGKRLHERRRQRSQHLMLAVVQAHRVAAHFDHAHRRLAVVCGPRDQLLQHGRCQPDADQRVGGRERIHG